MYRKKAKETLSASASQFDTRKYYGYNPFEKNDETSLHRMDESFKSLNSAGSRYSRASNNSIKSQGVRGGFASRNLKNRGVNNSFSNDLFDRKYDSVAESLYRI